MLHYDLSYIDSKEIKEQDNDVCFFVKRLVRNAETVCIGSFGLIQISQIQNVISTSERSWIIELDRNYSLSFYISDTTLAKREFDKMIAQLKGK